jgi:thiol:disulfide interchange protein DsbD
MPISNAPIRAEAAKTPHLEGFARPMLGAVLAVAAAVAAHDPASAQIGETVAWTLAAPAAASVKPGGRVVLSLRGVVKDGWHVYGLNQLPAGPTPLRVALESNAIAASAGPITASPPTRQHDPSFNLETQYYSRDVTVTAPIRISAKAASGVQQVPLTVRYQTCDGRFCQPPKTVRLNAAVTVTGG